MNESILHRLEEWEKEAQQAVDFLDKHFDINNPGTPIFDIFLIVSEALRSALDCIEKKDKALKLADEEMTFEYGEDWMSNEFKIIREALLSHPDLKGLE